MVLNYAALNMKSLLLHHKGLYGNALNNKHQLNGDQEDDLLRDLDFKRLHSTYTTQHVSVLQYPVASKRPWTSPEQPPCGGNNQALFPAHSV